MGNGHSNVLGLLKAGSNDLMVFRIPKGDKMSEELKEMVRKIVGRTEDM